MRALLLLLFNRKKESSLHHKRQKKNNNNTEGEEKGITHQLRLVCDTNPQSLDHIHQQSDSV